MSGRDSRPSKRLPAPLVAHHLRSWLREHTEEVLIEKAGVSYNLLRRVLEDPSFTIGFSTADALLCAVGVPQAWLAPPLLEHYERILVPPSKRARTLKPCRGCGGTKSRGAGTSYCDACEAKGARELKPCRCCGGEKERGCTSAYCETCRPVARQRYLERERRRVAA